MRVSKMVQMASKQSSASPLTMMASQRMHTLSSLRRHSVSLSLRRSFGDAAELDSADILERIKKVLGEMERAKTDLELTADSHIYNDVGLDSLDFVEFGIALEDEFGIEIEDDKAEGITTVGDAIQLIKDSQKVDTA